MATIMSKDEEQFWLAEKEVVVCETPPRRANKIIKNNNLTFSQNSVIIYI